MSQLIDSPFPILCADLRAELTHLNMTFLIYFHQSRRGMNPNIFSCTHKFCFSTFLKLKSFTNYYKFKIFLFIFKKS